MLGNNNVRILYVRKTYPGLKFFSAALTGASSAQVVGKYNEKHDGKLCNDEQTHKFPHLQDLIKEF